MPSLILLRFADLEDALDVFLTSDSPAGTPRGAKAISPRRAVPQMMGQPQQYACYPQAQQGAQGPALTAARSSAPLAGKRSRPTIVPANRRSFKDYTKPIKRGFLNRQIPANDVRRHLAGMVIGAVNSHHPGHLETVLASLCGPTVVMTSRFIGDASALPFANAVVHRELHGVAHIAHYLDALFEVVPDALIRLLDSKVHMFQNGCSYIVGKFVFQGSKCYDLVTQGDTRSAALPRGRALPGSQFDRHVPAPKAQMAVQQSEGDGLSDLEALLFESEDEGEEEEEEAFFPQQQHAQQQQPAMLSSVALEHRPVDYLVAHPASQVTEVPLRFLGTIAFYLDPEAKIFKVEVLNSLEVLDKDGAAAGNQNKKARKC